MYLSLVSWEILYVKWSHVYLSGDIPGKALSSALGYIPQLWVTFQSWRQNGCPTNKQDTSKQLGLSSSKGSRPAEVAKWTVKPQLKFRVNIRQFGHHLNTNLSPGLHLSTRSLSQMMSILRGSWPAGAFSGISCNVTVWWF